MKFMKLTKYFFASSLLLLGFAACKKSEYVNANLNPNTLYTIKPEDQFLAAAISSQNDFEYYYDVYRSMNLWMQYAVVASGNSTGFINPGSHFDYRYNSTFYNSVGPDLSDIPRLISQLPEEDQPRYVYLNDIAAIYKAYYAFYVSDINGSIPYSQAFQGRYGGTTEPVYDRQQDLFDTLDLQIKTSVASLETAQTAAQVQLGAKDPFFGTATDQTMAWIKAGNALRLKIALRLMKQDPTKMTAIVTEVLADANQMSENADGWVLTVGPTYAKGDGNYNPTGFAAGKAVLDFMVAKDDPRLRNFYTKNSAGVYLGASASPDVAKANPTLYNAADTFSVIEPRLFTPNYVYASGPLKGLTGSGQGFFVFLTYAEYCFIRADLGARNFTSDDPAAWYEKGITASINFYDQRAAAAVIQNYTPVTPVEIAAYLAQPGVAYVAATGIEQIADQANLEFFRQPSEAWAWWKRTGYPNTTSTILPWEVLKISGNTVTIPRRAVLGVKLPTDPNYANQQAAYTEMATNPGFGSGPDDPFGRVWWDKP